MPSHALYPLAHTCQPDVLHDALTPCAHWHTYASLLSPLPSQHMPSVEMVMIMMVVMVMMMVMVMVMVMMMMVMMMMMMMVVVVTPPTHPCQLFFLLCNTYKRQRATIT